MPEYWTPTSFFSPKLHLVLPELNLSVLDADILTVMQQVRLIMFSWNMVDYTMSFLSLST